MPTRTAGFPEYEFEVAKGKQEESLDALQLPQPSPHVLEASSVHWAAQVLRFE